MNNPRSLRFVASVVAALLVASSSVVAQHNSGAAVAAGRGFAATTIQSLLHNSGRAAAAQEQLDRSSGSTPTSSIGNDVWVLTSANGQGGAPQWSRLKASGHQPVGRVAHTAVYDPLTNRMIVHAGFGAEGDYRSTWVLTHANGQ